MQAESVVCFGNASAWRCFDLWAYGHKPKALVLSRRQMSSIPQQPSDRLTTCAVTHGFNPCRANAAEAFLDTDTCSSTRFKIRFKLANVALQGAGPGSSYSYSEVWPKDLEADPTYLPTTYLPIYLSAYLPIYLSTCLSAYLYFHPAKASSPSKPKTSLPKTVLMPSAQHSLHPPGPQVLTRKPKSSQLVDLHV